jgi:hypothetical protein
LYYFSQGDEIFQSDSENEEHHVQVPYDPRVINETCSPDSPWPIRANASKKVIEGNIHLNYTVCPPNI